MTTRFINGVIIAFLALCLGQLILLVALVVRADRRSIRRLNLKCPECAFEIETQFDHAVDRCPECGTALDLARFRT